VSDFSVLSYYWWLLLRLVPHYFDQFFWVSWLILTHRVGLSGISAASPSPVGGVAAAPSKNGGAKSIIVPSFYTVFGAVVLGCVLSMVFSVVAGFGVITAV
jgi:hypothetical protein